MATKYVALEQLTHYNEKIAETYVKKEHKTGSEEEYKVLSDNNLTDELKTKIENAGDSSFSGDYADLTSKPTIDGHEITGTMTSDDLGLAKAADLPAAATSEKAGLVKPDGESVKVTEDGTISVELPDVSDMETKTHASSTYAAKTEIEDMATKTQVASDISDAKEEVLAEAKTLVTGVYTPKGSVAFDGLPTPSKDNVGFVYDVNEQFVTDDKFNERSKSYPAGTNVVVVDNGGDDYKYDTLSGSVDLSGYLQKTDIESVTNEDIDALFS